LGPWTDHWEIYRWRTPPSGNQALSIESLAYLGAAAVLLSSAESAGLYSHMEQRFVPDAARPERELPVPEDLKQVFRDWAEEKINFLDPT